MKKQIIILIAFLMISAGFLCGCNNKRNEPQIIDLTKVEIIDNYTIETRYDFLGEEYKKIHGYLINNAGKLIERIEIQAEFYDSSDNYIITKYYYIYDLANKNTDDFQFIYHSANDYYYNVDWDKIQFSLNFSDDIT